MWFPIPIVICRSQFRFLIFLVSSSKSKNCARISLQNKKWIIFILKGFIKQSVIKQSLTCLRFFFHWLLMSVFHSFLIKTFSDIERPTLLFKKFQQKVDQHHLHRKRPPYCRPFQRWSYLTPSHTKLTAAKWKSRQRNGTK